MKYNLVHAASTQNQTPSSTSKVIREGSSVLVRIISRNGEGRYQASVGGIRMEIKSSALFKAGQTFTGIIRLQNGEIQIQRTDSSSPLTFVSVTPAPDIEGLFSPVTDTNLLSMLQSLNLPGDNFSLLLVRQFKQLGLKLSPEVMNRIRNLAQKTKNPQKTMEKLVCMYQNSLSMQESFIPEDLFFDSNSKKHQDNEIFPENPSFSINNPDFLKNFITSLFEGKLNNKPGLLTVMNHMGLKKSDSLEKTWVSIPFSIVDITQSSITGGGNFSFLLGSNKDLSLMNVSAFLKNIEYRFSFDFRKETLSENNGKKTLRFSINGPDTDIEKEIQRLYSLFPEYNIRYCKFDLLYGNASSSETLLTAGGYA